MAHGSGSAAEGEPSTARLAEVHRLAVAGHQAVIARNTGNRLARRWLRRSRFAEVAALTRSTLTLGPDADALDALGAALASTRQQPAALAAFEQALALYRRP